MSGHSKWSKVKHIKAVEDVRKAKVFSKHLRAIAVTARQGGGDPDFNPRLRAAVLSAQLDNVPKDNIERAIKRGTGEMEGVEYEEITYEGYGPGGVAILIEVLTDNRNRTLPELRHIFDRKGGSLGQDGCVAWMFDRKGFLSIAKEGRDEEAVMELGLEAGAEDMQDAEESWEILTPAEGLEEVVKAYEGAQIDPSVAEIQMVPKSQVRVEGEDARKLLRLIDALEDHDDVQHVWSNYDVPEQVMEAFAAEA